MGMLDYFGIIQGRQVVCYIEHADNIYKVCVMLSKTKYLQSVNVHFKAKY